MMIWTFSYNYDNNANLGQGGAATKASNEIAALFKEKTDQGALEIDLQKLA